MPPTQTPSTSQHPPRRSTIEDVAASANVSVATVSRALRNLPNVANTTRDKIKAVAAALDYAPDPAASRLAAGRTHTVTIVVPNLNSWYFSNIVAGVEAVAADAGYDVLVLGVGSLHDLSRLLSESYHLERRTDGLVVVDVPIAPFEAASITARGVAITTVGTRTDGHPSIRVDNEQVGRIAANHLIDLGHERLGVIGSMKDDPMQFEVPTLRAAGFNDALERRNLALDPALVEGGNFGVDGGRDAMAALLDHGAPPTAVFAMSDEMAFGAIMAMNERGLRPGHDVSLIGVDDHEFSRVVNLTTIRQPVVDHGAAAAQLLLDAMSQNGNSAAGRHTGAPHIDSESTELTASIELVVRSTTAPR